MDHLAKVYRKSDSVVFRKIGDEFILVPIRQNVGDLDSIYTLNETAALIWELIDGQRCVQDILDQLVAKFDVSAQEAEQDLLEILSELKEIGAIKETAHGLPTHP